MISVGNVRKVELPGEHVYIGRAMPGIKASPLGNPIKFGYVCRMCGERHYDDPRGRAQLIECYSTYLSIEWAKKGGKVEAELIRLAKLSKSVDIVLDCWCAPKACHGDMIKLAIELIVENSTRL